MRRNHSENHDSDLKYFARCKDRVAVLMSAKHSAEHPAGDGEVWCAKKDPRYAHREKSPQTACRPTNGIVQPGPIGATNPDKSLDNEIRTVQQPPYDKRPGGAVPQTA